MGLEGEHLPVGGKGGLDFRKGGAGTRGHGHFGRLVGGDAGEAGRGENGGAFARDAQAAGAAATDGKRAAVGGRSADHLGGFGLAGRTERVGHWKDPGFGPRFSGR